MPATIQTDPEKMTPEQLRALVQAQRGELDGLKTSQDQTAKERTLEGKVGTVKIITGDFHSQETGNQWVQITIPYIVGRTTNDGKKWNVSTTRGAKGFKGLDHNGNAVTFGTSVNCTLTMD